jgi:transposase
MACDFLLKWPDLASVQNARPHTLRKFYYAHGVRRGDLIEQRIKAVRIAKPLIDDAAIIEVSRLSVQALARLLRDLADVIAKFDKQIEQVFAQHAEAYLFNALPGAGKALAPRLLCALGTDRERFADATEVQTFAGIAPVTRRSGKRCHVHRRWAAPKFLRQTFHEFAQHSIGQSAWAKAYYTLQLQRGKAHHAAVRALAFKWIRVLFACWRTRTVYDESRYLQQLHRRQAPLLKYMTAAT